MKKLFLIMVAFMASFSLYAQEVKTNVEEEVETAAEPIVLDTVYLSSESLTSPNPIVITASLPSDVKEILSITHPNQPGYLSTWSYGNGIITITIPVGDLTGFSQGNITINARDATYMILLVVI